MVAGVGGDQFLDEPTSLRLNIIFKDCHELRVQPAHKVGTYRNRGVVHSYLISHPCGETDESVHNHMRLLRGKPAARLIGSLGWELG